MIYSYVFIAEAQEEYEEALTWYLEKNEKAPEGFIKAVDEGAFQNVASKKRITLGD